MGTDIMSNVIIKKRKHSLDFFQNGRWIYDVSSSQIKLHGVEFWLNHLSDKNWFCDSVKAQFLSLVK
jgi:hypothetical protein